MIIGKGNDDGWICTKDYDGRYANSRMRTENCTRRKRQMRGAIAQTFREHPEYLLYVLSEEEYKEVLRWTKLPCGIVSERMKNSFGIAGKQICVLFFIRMCGRRRRNLGLVNRRYIW